MNSSNLLACFSLKIKDSWVPSVFRDRAVVTGIKRPHLNWRSPPGYVDLYPLQNVSLPKQRAPLVCTKPYRAAI